MGRDNVLSIRRKATDGGRFIEKCYAISRERLIEIVGYLTDDNEHEKLCKLIHNYISFHDPEDGGVMGVLFEALGDRELIYDPTTDVRLHRWVERMKDNQV